MKYGGTALGCQRYHRRPWRVVRLTLGCALAAACLAPMPAHAADLEPRTAQAYEKYADEAMRGFVSRAQKAAAMRSAATA